jgi:hypothetical protein
MPVIYNTTNPEFSMSGWRDSNPRPPAPHAGAIPGYATSRKVIVCCDDYESVLSQLLTTCLFINVNFYANDRTTIAVIHFVHTLQI